MPKSYSIADAKSHLGRLVHQVEAGSPIELTRRGQPVAVVLSIKEFQRLNRPPKNSWEVVQNLRNIQDLAKEEIDPEEVFADDRNEPIGREFSW